jgi:hypothetical protein
MRCFGAENAMSKDVVKDGEPLRAINPLPDRPIPSEPSLVTAEGLAHIEATIVRLEGEQTRARAANGGDAATSVLVRPARERALRYPARDNRCCAIRVDGRTCRDGDQQTYRIVGIDEVDPAAGTLSPISPLARSLMGRSAGDSVRGGATTIEIIAIR